MHIKRIAIVGFKSYSDQIFEEPLSAQHNVVVGRNGSGKSNFFNAILFVLSEKYTQLHPAERRELLHAAAGAPVLSAYVEITFDNADGRLVIPGHHEEGEVSIRRTIGIQKDEFRVNDRAMSTKDVRQLLEGAGFSTANPYYVVEQGRIVHIAGMSEAERLSVVKEVAGTKVYEHRRRECMDILEDTQAKRTRIDEAFEKLEAQRVEAEKESGDVAKLRDLERTMRKIEYCLYTHEAKKVQKEIEARGDAQAPTGAVDALYAKKTALEAETQALDSELRAQTQRLELLGSERKRLDEDRSILAGKQTRNDMVRRTTSERMSAAEAQHATLAKERDDLTAEMQKLRKDVESKTQELGKVQQALDAANTAQSALEANVMRMQTRRGNAQLFKNAADRNKWLTEEIRRSNEAAKSSERALDDLRDDAEAAKRGLQEEQERVNAAQKTLGDAEATIKANDAERIAKIRERDSLYTDRRGLMQKLDECQNTLKAERDTLNATKTVLDRALGSRDIRDGLQTLQAMLKELQVTDRALFNAVHGPVIDLFSCDEAFYTAVEVTAGNALFNIVVEKAQHCTALLKYMNDRKMPGRLTVLALESCKAAQVNISETPEATPLIKHLTYNPKYEKVFQSIFGKTVVAASMEVAAVVSSTQNCAAVTLDGDQINTKGGMRGGFLNRTPRIALNNDVKKRTAAVDACLADYRERKQALAEAEQGIHAASAFIENKEAANAALLQETQAARRSLQQAHEKTAQLQRALARAEESITSTKASLEKAKETAKALTVEKSADFRAEFSAKEEAELEEATNSLNESRAGIAFQAADVAKRTTEMAVLQDTIAQCTARLDLIAAQLSTFVGAGLEVSSERCTIEQKALDAQIQRINAKITEIDAELTKNYKSKQKRTLALHEKRQEEAEAGRAYDKALEARTQAQSSKFLLDNQLEELHIKMRQTGMAEAEVSAFRAMGPKRLVEEAKQCSSAVDALGHVNRRAVEQLTTIQDRLRDLGEKRAGSDQELAAIHDMLQKLDAQKDEAIERTVKQVQHHFEQVFLELVTAQGASAALLLRETPGSGSTGVDAYAGIHIQVCFGLGQPTIELAQLSGGQRSLVALALIFAIQRCDPAPFYLFDEIDAALDASYRTAVADMIRRQSAKTQFITATFKEEMLASANRVYGIFNRNRVSRIQEISMDEGRALLQQEAIRVAQEGAH